MTEAAGFVDEEFGGVALVNEDDGDDEKNGLQDACEVFGPAPAERWGLDYSSRGNWS